MAVTGSSPSLLTFTLSHNLLSCLATDKQRPLELENTFKDIYFLFLRIKKQLSLQCWFESSYILSFGPKHFLMS